MDRKEYPVFVCRCEEVTESEVRKVIRTGAQTVDDIKRATRAGMGLCQSKSCYTNIARIIHEELWTPIEEIESIRIRIPVRPMRVDILSD